MRKGTLILVIGLFVVAVFGLDLYLIFLNNKPEEDTMPLTVTKKLMDAQTLRVKFFTAGYSPEVDRYLNEEMEKFLHEDLTKYRTLDTAPSLFISSAKDILIAVPYRELVLDDEEIVKYIIGMEEEELQSFLNWEKVIRNLTEKGYQIGTQ